MEKKDEKDLTGGEANTPQENGAEGTRETVKAIMTSEQIFVAYSRATKVPYVTCDPETFNDQAWLFSSEEEIKAFGQKKAQEKVLIMGMGYKKKDYRILFETLYAIGVNTVVWNAGEERTEIELSSIIRIDVSKLEESKRPLFNPSLQLSSIYYVQEFNLPEEVKDKEKLREHYDEVLANLERSQFMVPLIRSEEDEKKVQIPYLKNKEGEILQPIFTDVTEFFKFSKGKKMHYRKVPFQKLPGMLMKQSKCFVLNPFGVHLMFGKDQINRILGVQDPGAQPGS
ncbi:MAG: SseB family protein [Eubacteriales bacterium]|nr:SseB family protein [Eubacteriales bacterium]